MTRDELRNAALAKNIKISDRLLADNIYSEEEDYVEWLEDNLLKALDVIESSRKISKELKELEREETFIQKLILNDPIFRGGIF